MLSQINQNDRNIFVVVALKSPIQNLVKRFRRFEI